MLCSPDHQIILSATKNHKFYKSIDEVNIGGLPFLPSATELVTELLDELISNSDNRTKYSEYLDNEELKEKYSDK